jgi:hypothetical protein
MQNLISGGAMVVVTSTWNIFWFKMWLSEVVNEKANVYQLT